MNCPRSDTKGHEGEGESRGWRMEQRKAPSSSSRDEREIRLDVAQPPSAVIPSFKTHSRGRLCHIKVFCCCPSAFLLLLRAFAVITIRFSLLDPLRAPSCPFVGDHSSPGFSRFACSTELAAASPT